MINNDCNYYFAKKDSLVIPLLTFFIFLLLSGFNPFLYGDISFQDSEGNEIVNLFGGGGVSINTADGALTLGITLRNKSNWCCSVRVSSKATNGAATLLKGGNLNPGVKMNLNLSYYLVSQHKKKGKEIIMLFNPIAKKGEALIKEKYELKLKKNKNRITEIEKERKQVDLRLSGDKKNSLTESEIKRLRCNLVVMERERDYLKEEKKRLETAKSADEKKLDKHLTVLQRAISNNEPIGEDTMAYLNKEMSEVEEYLNLKSKNLDMYKLPLQTSWFNLGFSYNLASYKMLDVDHTFSDEIQNVSFDGIGAEVSYNSYLSDYNVLFRVAAGLERTNNIGFLPKTEVIEDKVLGSLNNGETVRKSRKTYTVRQGEFKQFIRCHLLASGFLRPTDKLGVLAYYRYYYSNFVRGTNIGLGAYFLKCKEKNNFFTPLVGILVSFDDHNKMKEDVKFKDRFTLSLVVNIPFIIF